MISEKEFKISQEKLADETIAILNKYMFSEMEYSGLWKSEIKAQSMYSQLTSGI